MSEPEKNHEERERVAEEAAAWVLRTDRGLTPEEQDAFSEWLAMDASHGPALAEHRRHWQRLDRLAQWRPEHGARPNPDLLAPPLRRRVLRFAPVFTALGAAAAIAIAFIAWKRDARDVDVDERRGKPAVVATEISQRVLADGSIVELNRGAAITEDFSHSERRVRLERGEAHFAVQKDPERPFVVHARGVDVRAVGTAFNVRVDAEAVEVLVTEGQVKLEAGEGAGAATAEREDLRTLVPALNARQRAVVSLAASVPQIATLTTGEIERVLAWQHRLLDFDAVPLRDIVAEFNRRNVVQLVVLDPELAAQRVTAKLRSDNIDGFVRMLEMGFSARAERRGEQEIVLRAGR